MSCHGSTWRFVDFQGAFSEYNVSDNHNFSPKVSDNLYYVSKGSKSPRCS